MGLFSSFSLAVFVFLIAGPVPKGLSSPYRCDPYWYYYGGHCYRFFGYYLDWHSAAVYCYDWSGFLASILSKAEADVVAAYLLYQNPSGSDVWIGLNKLNGTWAWIETGLTYEAWDAGQPNNPYHYCGALTYSSGYQKWNDAYCYSHYPFICKKVAYL